MSGGYTADTPGKFLSATRPRTTLPGISSGYLVDLANSLTSTFQAADLPDRQKKERQVFVAYAYALYPKADYRKVFSSIKRSFGVNFVFADEKITNLHVLTKIENFVKESQFGIYDISGWNANVTLELGLAFGLHEKAYIAFDPSKTPTEEVPADLRGIDRIQYSSYSEYEDKLSELMAQELPVQITSEAENQLTILRQRVIAILDDEVGLKIGEIATALGISTGLAQVVMRPLVGRGVRTTGHKRATRYFVDLDSLPRLTEG